jgi:hypothetical protein
MSLNLEETLNATKDIVNFTFIRKKIKEYIDFQQEVL